MVPKDHDVVCLISAIQIFQKPLIDLHRGFGCSFGGNIVSGTIEEMRYLIIFI